MGVSYIDAKDLGNILLHFQVHFQGTGLEVEQPNQKVVHIRAEGAVGSPFLRMCLNFDGDCFKYMTFLEYYRHIDNIYSLKIWILGISPVVSSVSFIWF